MGNAATNPHYGHEDGEEDLDPFDGIDTLGYRVLGVQPNSPAADAGLVSFLDFLVGANGKLLLGSGEDLQPGEEYDDIDLPALLEEHKGKPVEFLVWNMKSQTQRFVYLTPSDSWGGAGLLGVTIRLDNYAGAEDRLVRILSVEDKSPAAIAGLVPEKDYLLGTSHHTLDSTSSLSILLRDHQDRVVELYVYNSDSDLVRVVALMPTLSWGGAGLLGAEVGTGYLHRLPAKTRETDGASVQRKVRYVGVKSAPPSGTSHHNHLTTLKKRDDEDDHEHAVLEVEPQLEMEPPDDDDDDDESNSADHHVTENEKETTGETTKEIASAVSNENNVDNKSIELDAPSVASVESPSSTSGAETQSRRSSEGSPIASDVFSKPPAASAMSYSTGTANTLYGNVSFLPPPPRMHYDTPSKLSS